MDYWQFALVEGFIFGLLVSAFVLFVFPFFFIAAERWFNFVDGRMAKSKKRRKEPKH